MITRLRRFGEEVDRGYAEYDFQLVFRETVQLASVDLSSFYFDILKDILYADDKDSRRRQSAQVVLALVSFFFFYTEKKTKTFG